MKYAVRIIATVLGIVLVVLGAVQLVLGVWFMFDENDLGLGTAGRVIVGLVYGGILGLGMAAAGVFLIRRGLSPRGKQVRQDLSSRADGPIAEGGD